MVNHDPDVGPSSLLKRNVNVSRRLCEYAELCVWCQDLHNVFSQKAWLNLCTYEQYVLPTERSQHDRLFSCMPTKTVCSMFVQDIQSVMKCIPVWMQIIRASLTGVNIVL